MANDKLRLARKYFTTILRFAFSILGQRIRARIHRWSYRVTSSPLNIVVIGGSFAGIQLATRLTETLPNGYRVILVEKKSHFNYTFNFPRYSVLQGHEQLAFIPYTGVVNAAPKGSLDLVQGEIIEISENEVELASGEKLGFEYLAIATGSGNGLPAKVASDEKARGRAELKKLQLKIEKADGVAVVGGGAVGVQMVGDIRSWYPGKRIALVHSRAQLLPNFGPRLHEHVLKELENMDVTVFLGQRPKLPVYETEGIALKTEDGEVVKFDLVIPCTGQTPNASFLTSFSPSSISTSTGSILVTPTLQLSSAKQSIPNIYAFGDVAETGGPKMARAGLMQGDIVLANILASIKGFPLKTYVPTALEGSIKLTLGKDKAVMYSHDEEEEFLIPVGGGGEDLSALMWWGRLGANMKNCEA